MGSKCHLTAEASGEPAVKLVSICYQTKQYTWVDAGMWEGEAGGQNPSSLLMTPHTSQ